MGDHGKPRRPGSHWGATDRDLVGLKHRTPPRGVEQDDRVELGIEGDQLEQAVGPAVVRQLRELADELTPPPVDTNEIPREPTAGEAWQHATHVNRRVVDLLSQIAHSSGAGMSFGDEIAKLRRGRRITFGISMGALISAIAGLIAVGTKLYGRGYDAGVDQSWKTYIERSVEKNAERIERLEWRRYRNDPEPSPKVIP